MRLKRMRQVLSGPGLYQNKGHHPYRYLETVRINQAKQLLEKGLEPLETAYQTGFSDQSHFTNFFKEFIGITPNNTRKYLAHMIRNPGLERWKKIERHRLTDHLAGAILSGESPLFRQDFTGCF